MLQGRDAYRLALSGRYTCDYYCLTVSAIIDAPAGQVTLGASVPNGLEQKGIETITDCIKKCVSAGAGVPAVVPVCAL